MCRNDDNTVECYAKTDDNGDAEPVACHCFNDSYERCGSGDCVPLKDGNKAVGYVTSETDDSLSLRVLGGLTLDYKKSEILSKTALSQSLMTANIQATMSNNDLVDLVEYLTTLK